MGGNDKKKQELERQLEEISEIEKHFEEMGEVPQLEIALSSIRETREDIKRDISRCCNDLELEA